MQSRTEAMPQPLHDAAEQPVPGSYRELTPHEFDARKDMVVVVVKAPQAVGRFEGYRAVVHLAECKAVEPYLAQWPQGTVVGLVCPDGDCSSRMAIRLSRHGFTVYHLAGGLHEWFQAFPGCAAQAG